MREPRTQRPARPKRRWWQRICRGLVWTVLAAAAAYVALPWWVPTTMLRRWIAEDMARRTGLKVHIQDLSVSRGAGVELVGLRVDGPARFGGGPMLVVERVRTEFHPANYLFHRRLQWLELDELRLYVHVDDDGGMNLAALDPLMHGVQCRRISVRRAAVVWWLPRRPPPNPGLQLDVADLQFVAGRLDRLGRVTMSAFLKQPRAAGPAPASLSAGPGGGGIAASMSLHFANVDLAALDLPGLLGKSPFWGRFWDNPSLSASEKKLMVYTRQTAHAHLSAMKGADFVLLVTEPTPFGLHDLKLAVGAVEILGIPCGLVINRSDMGDDKVKAYANEKGLPILMEIPFSRRIAEAYSRGEVLVDVMSEWKEKFLDLYQRMIKIVGSVGVNFDERIGCHQW